MPRELIHAACEKVLLDEGQSPSLISIFDTLTVMAPADATLPSNAVVPKDWAVYASWLPDEQDGGKTYSVCTQLFFPDNTPFGETVRFNLAMASGKRAQGITRLNAFPIGQTGFYKVHSWLEHDGKHVGRTRELLVEVEISRMPVGTVPPNVATP